MPHYRLPLNSQGSARPSSQSRDPAGRAAYPARVSRTDREPARTLAEVDAAGTSPLYERVAVALSESGEAMRAIETAPARKRHPTVVLAALHDLVLAGQAPALAAAYAAADGDAAAGAAVGTLLRMTGSVWPLPCAGRCGPARPGAAPCCTRPSPRRRAGSARMRSG